MELLWIWYCDCCDEEGEPRATRDEAWEDSSNHEATDSCEVVVHEAAVVR